MWKKYGKYILSICAIFLIVFFIGSPLKIADSGFDYSYDSGSDWGGSSDWGSSSWDSDYDYDYDYGGSSGSSSGFSLIFTFIFFAIIIICIATPSNKNSRNNNNVNLRRNFTINPIPDSEITDILPGFNRQEFLEKAYSIYIDVQNAWMNFELDSVRNILTDELYSMYSSQLETLNIKNQQNIMEDFDLERFDIVGIYSMSDCVELKTKMVVKFKDYIIDKSTKQVLRGNSHRSSIVVYELDFIKYKNSEKVDVCPHCGAKVDLNTSTKCEYCASTLVNDKNNDFVLSKKKVVYQRLV